MAVLVSLCFILLSAGFSVQQEEQQPRVCHKAVSDLAQISVEQDDAQLPGTVSQETSQVCNVGNYQACYTLWKETKTSSNATEIVIIAQGCWESSGKEDCNSPVCVAHGRSPKAMNDTKFCCCSGDLCNNNFSIGYDDTRVEYNTATHISSSENQSKAVSRLSLRDAVVIIFSCLVTLTIGFFGSVALYKSCHSPNKRQMLDSVRLVENIQNEQPLKMIELVGQGRYGSLWKGMNMNKDGQLVAVKMFPPHYRQLYCNERDIYSLPFMDNPAIVSYYGCQESSGQLQLILLYCNLGCLQDYIRVNTVDSSVFCRMAASIAKGLAHLHTEIRHGDKYKPCICHRDLNTRNILVKSDLSCCICDLGLALKITDSHHCGGEEAAIKAISDVGTLRYMAPEVLEGAVNLRDCESSLKQIDVYALGLVLWELATRCSDFYIGNASPVPYAMPFEAEIGQHPSFEQMLQVMVSRNKARPLFPPLWRDCPAVRLVRETIEDCWDQDAEARLTALCVEERLSDLTQLCLRESQGCYPYSLGVQIISFNNATSDNNTTTTEDTVDSTVSEGTVETLVTMSPSEPAPPYSWKDSNSRANKTANVAITIQPYQGRNPCLERNLLMWGDTEEGDNCTLVDRSMKHQVTKGEQPPVILQPAVSNIPYVHNRVPKQSNVPPSNQLPGFIRKLLALKKLNLPVASEDCHLLCNGTSKDVKVTISPFEKHSSEENRPSASGGRPTSLPLELGSVFLDAQSGRIKRELSDRIKTPGDVPPSVRRKRARLSLYDDRIMDQSASSF